jgi:putative phosphotransacetylase
MNLQDRFVIDRSANHIHLTQETADLLFGEDVMMTLKPLAIAGEYATNLKVAGENCVKYTVLYPWRSYNQLELAASDFYKQFKYYPKRVASGQLDGAPTLTVGGTTCDIVDVPVIVAEAHVHIAKESDLYLIPELNFPFPLGVKFNETTDGLSHIHLDTDQYAALQGL